MDVFSKKKRSQIMASIRSKDSKFEKSFLDALANNTCRELELHPKDIDGVPDAVSRNKKLAIFLDSCFWHGCKIHYRMPKSNREYWSMKLEKNRKRDRFVSAYLRSKGWKVVRIWEHSLRKRRSRKWWLTRLTNLLR